MPLAGVTLTPGAEADQEVEPVMAEPPLMMVNSTCPVLALQAPLTEMLDLSQTGAEVFVGVGVYVEVSTPAPAAGITTSTVGVGVGSEESAAGASVGGASTTGASVGGASSTGGSSAGGSSTAGASVASAPDAPDKNSPPGAHDAIRSDSMTVREIILKMLKRAFVFIQPLFSLIMAVMPKQKYNDDNSCKNKQRRPSL